MLRVPARIGLRACLLLALVVLVAAGCGRQVGETPAPTPADFEGIVDVLHLGGFTVSDVVSGDPGCTDRTLAGPAISALVRMQRLGIREEKPAA